MGYDYISLFGGKESFREMVRQSLEKEFANACNFWGEDEQKFKVRTEKLEAIIKGELKPTGRDIISLCHHLAIPVFDALKPAIDEEQEKKIYLEFMKSGFGPALNYKPHPEISPNDLVIFKLYLAREALLALE